MRAKVRELNDAFRTTFRGGRVCTSADVDCLPDDMRTEICKKVRRFSDFNEENDPYGEHDFGAIDIDAKHKVFWKIDYYDAEGVYGSEDPANPDVTTRVLTIFFADEY